MLHLKFRMRSTSTALATLLACASPGLTASLARADGPVSPRHTATVLAIQAAEPAVVNIEGNKPSGKPTGEAQLVNGMGSGVIIDPRGYVLTNQHVVQDVTRIEVTLHDGSKYIGRMIDHDPSTDLALVKIDVPRDLPVIRFGTSSDLLRGEKVVAIGNPFGYQHTVTEGIISALHRDIPVNGVQEYEDLIQTDASINPGNSGGPLVNIEGKMIGLNAAVRVGAQGIGFAIPVDKALEVAANLISAHREYGADVPFEVHTSAVDGRTEVRISRIRSNQSGTTSLVEGDCIKRIGDRRIRNRLEYELALLDKPVGSMLDLEIERGGQARLEQVATTARIGSGVSLVSARNADSSSYAWSVLGMRLRPADAQLVRQVDASYSGGLQVVSVREQSPAYHAQLRPGDVLVGLMEWQTPNFKDLEWVFQSEDLKSSAKPRFRIIRGKNVYYGTFELNRTAAR
ncbi:MAG: trypsin-like peptidase domain-containing protein [Aureliella sp.]|jgi:serine protease Do